MKSLVLFLFLGATVALAEIHAENDPYRKHHHHPMLVSLKSLLYLVLSATDCSNRFKENSTINNLINLVNSFQWSQLSLWMVDTISKEL